MQRPRPLDVAELALEPRDPLADQTAIDFELALSGTAEEAEPAALAFEVGPRTDQPRPLVGECGQLDLEPPLVGARPRAENFEDQTGPVDDLCLPVFFEGALLHRAQRAVDDDDADPIVADHGAESVECPAAEQAARPRPCDRRDLGAHDIETDCLRQTNRLLQPSLDRAASHISRPPPGQRFWRRVNDERATGAAAICGLARVCGAQDSSISLFDSKSWMGCPGITVDIACL